MAQLENRRMTSALHKALMKKMGVSHEEDEKWHKRHGRPEKAPAGSRRTAINCFAVGGGFLSYCVRQGWLIQEGKGRTARYYATQEGKTALRQFGIEV